MENEKKFITCQEDLINLGCRVFDPRVTMDQITDNLTPKEVKQFLEWGVEKQLGVVNNEHDESIGVILKLNHKNYEETIYITLNFLDYYNVHFILRNGEVVHTIEDVGCEELYSVIQGVLNCVMKVEVSLN